VVERSSRYRWTGLAIALAIAVAAVVAWIQLGDGQLDPQAAAAWLEAAGDRWWAPLLFIGLYTLFNTLLIPGTILTLTAGLIWGWLYGGLWVLAASTIGSFVPYLIARAGSPAVERLIRKRAGGLYEKLRSEGFITLLLMRLIPIVPYNLLNYAAGLAGIPARVYLLATFLGTIPAIFIFTWLAGSIRHGLISPREAFVRILLAGVLLGALALATRLFSGRIRSRLSK
jgi:uncharacterized membrane protein YdjX (TVP38/TMEM64 family)